MVCRSIPHTLPPRNRKRVRRDNSGQNPGGNWPSSRKEGDTSKLKEIQVLVRDARWEGGGLFSGRDLDVGRWSAPSVSWNMKLETCSLAALIASSILSPSPSHHHPFTVRLE